MSRQILKELESRPLHGVWTPLGLILVGLVIRAFRMIWIILVALFGIATAAFATDGDMVNRLRTELAQTAPLPIKVPSVSLRGAAGEKRTPDLSAPVSAQELASAKRPLSRVLLLYSNDRLLPANLRFDAGFRDTLGPALGEHYELYTEFLDAVRFPGDARDEAMASSLRVRYLECPPQVLVATGQEALRFFQKRRASLFPGTQLVFGGVGIHEEPFGRIEPDVAGVPMSLELAPTLDLILRLRPQTREIVFVFGSSEGDREWEVFARQESRSFESRVKVTFWKQLPFAELTNRASNLPPETAVFYLTYFQEPDGTNMSSSAHALELFAAKCSAPIFGPYDTYIGKGIVGGMMTDFAGEGAAVAGLVRRVLAGEAPREIGVQPPRPGVFQFDARQLDRWKISSHLLPPKSVIAFREPSIWEMHHNAVIVALAITTVLTVLVLLLLAAQHRARETAVSLSLAADAAHIGLWQRQPGAGEIIASARWRKIFGFPPKGPLPLEEVLARVHPDDQSGLLKAMENAARDGQPFTIEHRMIRPDGSLRWISSYGRSDLAHNGHGHGTRGASMDVTEQREAAAAAAVQRQELAHLSRISLLGVLSGALAHELSQPLGAILRNTEAAELFLQQEHPDLEELREIVADIRKDDQRAGAVIDRLRSLLKRREVELRPVDLGELMDDVHMLLHADQVRRHVDVTLDFPKNLPRVQADRILLQQVLLNLKINALDALFEGHGESKMIAVRARAVDSRTVEITVEDNGPGIPPDRMERLFEPFFTTKGHGLGFGLSICRTIIEVHHGKITAANREPHGAVFRIVLPIGKEMES